MATIGEDITIGTPAAPGLAVLVVGTAAGESESLRRQLRRRFAVAEFAGSTSEAERLLPRCHFDYVVIEVDSVDHPALPWLDALRASGRDEGFCICAADAPDVANACRRTGAALVLPQPFDESVIERLGTTPRPAATARPATHRTRGADAPRVQLIGDSPSIRRVRAMVERVAPTPATVLIEGETGTGKELIARLVHERSGRRGPFVPVNCGAIPPELMESELFGHARGAFTGAHQQREGLFVSARGGTLFLDEVSEMRADLQVKLLRALEEGRIRPVGADREIPIDVRIVASSQPGLRERVQQRQFREDLYYRLNVVHILLPGLRERPGDVAMLVGYFMQRVADEFGMTPVVLGATQLAELQSREWAGNVRELRNFVERTVLMGDLPQDDADESAPEVAPPAGGYPAEWTLEQVKQAHILRVLAHNEGNRSATARQLGVSRKTLERRLGPGHEAAGDE